MAAEEASATAKVDSIPIPIPNCMSLTELSKLKVARNEAARVLRMGSNIDEVSHTLKSLSRIQFSSPSLHSNYGGESLLRAFRLWL